MKGHIIVKYVGKDAARIIFLAIAWVVEFQNPSKDYQGLQALTEESEPKIVV